MLENTLDFHLFRHRLLDTEIYINPQTNDDIMEMLEIWEKWGWVINSLAPGKLEWNFRYVIFKQILVTDGWGISREIALIWMSPDFTDDQSTWLGAVR